MNAKVIIGGTILMLLLIVGAYFIVSAPNNKPNAVIASYTTTDKDKPVVEVKKTLVDWGKIKVSDQKETSFTVKNIGTRPLELFNMSSSCHCTFGQVIYQGKASDEYGMATVSDEIASVEPGKEATVVVIYRPYIMPVYGPVEREVYLSTNDPVNQRLVFQVTASVQ